MNVLIVGNKKLLAYFNTFRPIQTGIKELYIRSDNTRQVFQVIENGINGLSGAKNFEIHA